MNARMYAWVAIVPVLSGGCDYIFRIDRVPSVGDASGDAIVDLDAATPDAPPGCSQTTELATLVADGAMDSDMPTNTFGSRAVIFIDPTARGLFRFQLPSSILHASYYGMELALFYANNGDELCGACTAGFCAPYELSSNVTAYPMLSGWEEFTFTWDQRTTGVAWTIPGAGAAGTPGNADHGSSGSTVAHVMATASTRFVFSDLEVVKPWITSGGNPMGGVLSFLVVSDGAAKLAVASREGTCNPASTHKASLTIHYCQ